MHILNRSEHIPGGWNSSVGSVLGSLSCVMQGRGFDPPLRRIYPVQGISPMVLTWVLTASSQKLFQMRV